MYCRVAAIGLLVSQNWNCFSAVALGTVFFKGTAAQAFGVEQSAVQKRLVHRGDC